MTCPYKPEVFYLAIKTHQSRIIVVTRRRVTRDGEMLAEEANEKVEVFGLVSEFVIPWQTL